MKVFIRADANTEIGLGHIVRCIALAHMLKNEFCVTFFCNEILEEIQKELVHAGFELHLIHSESEFIDKITPEDIVVLDGYQFDTDYQRKVKQHAAKLICIDDLHDKEFVADLIINHAPRLSPSDYRVQPYTQFALGPEYALLRPAFLKQAKKRRTVEKIDTLLICFGGSDFKNLTQSTLRLVLESGRFKRIIVVTGAAYNHLDSLKLLVNSNERIRHHHAVKESDMLNLMLGSDAVIVPSSGILLEVLAAGCIAISGYYTDNQYSIYKGFKAADAIIDAGNFNPPSIKAALNNLAVTNKRFIDGLSSVRIQKKIKELGHVHSDIS
jgi:UDP-2,4-diacetamido-2,4,6-trideoxy-beta-L-altropyranose hydrolase